MSSFCSSVHYNKCFYRPLFDRERPIMFYAGAGVTMGTMDVCLPADCLLSDGCHLVSGYSVNAVVGPSASWRDNKELKRNQMLKLKVSTCTFDVYLLLFSALPGPFLILAHLLPNPHAYIMHTLSVCGDVQCQRTFWKHVCGGWKSEQKHISTWTDLQDHELLTFVQNRQMLPLKVHDDTPGLNYLLQ